MSKLHRGLSLLAMLSACSNASSGSDTPDAAVGTGGAGGGPSGGTNSGGTNSGGTNSGGTTSGGTNSGGTNAGGTNSGGTNSGGTGSGGTDTGGTGGAGGEAPEVWADETDSPWTPMPPANLHQDLPVGAPQPAECTATWLTHVRGYILAPGGAPQEGARAQVCVRLFPSDNLLCIQPGTADATGMFTVQMPDNARCITQAALRILQPGVGKSTTYCPLPLGGPESVVVVEEPLVVFQTRRAIDLPPEGDTAQSRPIVFDDGLVIEFTPDLYYSGGGLYSNLGGRRVDPASPGLCFLGAENRPVGLYAMYPEGQINLPGFAAHLPNETGLPAGSQVELSVLGGLDCKRPDGTSVPEAGWEAIGTGTVSADGSMIDSDPGVGLPCLTWLGYRPLP